MFKKSLRKERQATPCMMGDMNPKVGDENVNEVVGIWVVPGRRESEYSSVSVQAERGLFLANTRFKHKGSTDM